MSEQQLTESEVRRLRDIVYGIPSTDKNWEGCSDNWMRPDSTKWLQETSKKKLS